jgi:hypothetical protein
MVLRRAQVLVLAVPLAVLVALAAPAAAGESKGDKAILKAGVITKNDVPSGWTSKKPSSDNSSFKGTAECKNIKRAVDNAKKKIPRARSREFQDPTALGGASAESTVYAFKNANAATTFLANYEAPQALTCLERTFTNSQGASTVSPVTDLQGVGDQAVGYEATTTIPVGGQQATLVVDFVIVRVGRAVLGFGFANRGERIPNGPTIVQAVVSRVVDVS